MRAAAQAGIDVPKLCATDQLEAFGSCRLCLVEIDGAKGYARLVHHAGRARHARPHPDRRRLDALRRGVMELYLSDHPLDCLTCPANGDCELQDMAGVVGVATSATATRVRTTSTRRPTTATRTSTSTRSKCIVCSRCVRACDEVQGTFALTIEGRGFDSKVAAGAGDSFMDSDCVSCGACVQACPTATLQEKSVVELGMPTRTRAHHLRLLRRRLLVQGRAARRPGRAHGARTRTAAPTRATPA